MKTMTTTTSRVEELSLLLLGSLVAPATSSELLLLDPDSFLTVSMFPDLRTLSACVCLLVGGVTLQVTGSGGSALVM